jgi:hypothetical protein
MTDYKYTPSNRVLLETAVKHLETLARGVQELQATQKQVLLETALLCKDMVYMDVGTSDRFEQLHERLDTLAPIVQAADRLVHEKETLAKQLATARRNLAEANAFINRPLRPPPTLQEEWSMPPRSQTEVLLHQRRKFP